MLDNDNIISTSVSDAVEKIPTDERLSQMLLYVFYFVQSQQLQRSDQRIANSRNSYLPLRIHPKKSQKTFHIKLKQKKMQ